MAKPQNLQDLFLNAARKQHCSVQVFLINGIKLIGKIQSFDNYVVLLSSKEGQQQLIYKHAISTVVPQHMKFDPTAPEEDTAQDPSA